jgi:fluoroacetyl-CoA thioesterase
MEAMMSVALQVGLKHSKTLLVDEALTVPRISPAFEFDDMPPVFATAFLVALVEWTCLDSLKPFLTPEQRTVGISVNINHLGATPVGRKVTVYSEITNIKGKIIEFKISARDDVQLISEGSHSRAIIDYEKFLSKL